MQRGSGRGITAAPPQFGKRRDEGANQACAGCRDCVSFSPNASMTSTAIGMLRRVTAPEGLKRFSPEGWQGPLSGGHCRRSKCLCASTRARAPAWEPAAVHCSERGPPRSLGGGPCSLSGRPRCVRVASGLQVSHDLLHPPRGAAAPRGPELLQLPPHLGYQLAGVRQAAPARRDLGRFAPEPRRAELLQQLGGQLVGVRWFL